MLMVRNGRYFHCRRGVADEERGQFNIGALYLRQHEVSRLQSVAVESWSNSVGSW